MKPELSAFERWMVCQNVAYVETEGLQVVVDRLKRNGYIRIANAVEIEHKEQNTFRRDANIHNPNVKR